MILTGDSREILPRLEPGTVDCIITSPPYYQLRDYNVSGQIGTEQTPEDYITTLTAIFAAAKTLLGLAGTLTLCSLYLTTCSETTLADHITNLLNYRQTIYQNLLAAVQNGTMELA